MEKSPTHNIEKETENIKDLFDLKQQDDVDTPHSIVDASLTFEKEHSFEAYKKERTIDQFGSDGGETFFKITRKRETQYLTSQILGGVIHASPMYIDEAGEYFSKKISYKENILEASTDLFILNVIANDWDHEIPYKEGIKVRDYENGSFYDFSHSDLATKNIQGGENKEQILRKTSDWLKELKQKLVTFAKEQDLHVNEEQIATEIKKSLNEKLKLLLKFISSDKTLKEIYYRIGYFDKYQHELLDPEELREVLNNKINIVIDQVKSVQRSTQ